MPGIYETYSRARIGRLQEMQSLRQSLAQAQAFQRNQDMKWLEETEGQLNDVRAWRGKTPEQMAPHYEKINAKRQQYGMPLVEARDPREAAAGKMFQQIIEKKVRPEFGYDYLLGAVGGDSDYLERMLLKAQMGELGKAREMQAQAQARAADKGTKREAEPLGEPVKAIPDEPAPRAMTQVSPAGLKSGRQYVFDKLSPLFVEPPPPAQVMAESEKTLDDLSVMLESPNPNAEEIQMGLVGVLERRKQAGLPMTIPQAIARIKAKQEERLNKQLIETQRMVNAAKPGSPEQMSLLGGYASLLIRKEGVSIHDPQYDEKAAKKLEELRKAATAPKPKDLPVSLIDDLRTMGPEQIEAVKRTYPGHEEEIDALASDTPLARFYRVLERRQRGSSLGEGGKLKTKFQSQKDQLAYENAIEGSLQPFDEAEREIAAQKRQKEAEVRLQIAARRQAVAEHREARIGSGGGRSGGGGTTRRAKYTVPMIVQEINKGNIAQAGPLELATKALGQGVSRTVILDALDSFVDPPAAWLTWTLADMKARPWFYKRRNYGLDESSAKRKWRDDVMIARRYLKPYKEDVTGDEESRETNSRRARQQARLRRLSGQNE